MLDWGRWSTPDTGRFNAWKDTRYPLHRRVVWAPGPEWTCAENFTLTGIRSPDRPVKSESLGHLRYVGPVYENNNNNNNNKLKQKVSAKTQRLSRYRKRQNQYYQNKLFRTECKKSYNCLRQTYSNVKNAPHKEEVENFWREVYGKRVQHNREVHWISKPVPTKSKHGMEPGMWKRRCRGTKSNAKLESPWRRSNSKFLA